MKDSWEEIRRYFILYAHATTCFENCIKGCDIIKEQNLTFFDSLFKPLSVWAAIEYGKPFKRSHGLPRIPNIIIPENYTDLHEFIISFRDKIVAHIDMDGQKSDETGIRLHSVKLEVTNKDLNYVVSEPKIGVEEVLSLRSLAKLLREKAHYHATKNLKKIYGHVKNFGQGQFLISPNDESNGIRKLSPDEINKRFWT